VGGRHVRGLTVAEALPEAAAQGFVALLDGVLETGEPFIGREVPYLRPDAVGIQDTRYVDFVYQALTDPDGTRTGVFVHGVDVTDQVTARAEVERLLRESDGARGEAEAARREAQRSAAAADFANHAKSQFLATMSHELRTPINAVLGYAQLLEIGVGGPVNEAQRGYLQRMAASGQHLLMLVNEVLDLAQIEAGGLRVAHEEALTGPAIQQAIDLVRPQAAAKGISVNDVRENPEGETFVGDEDRLRQIILNLLSNAVKFTSANGVVTVGCTREDETPAAAGRLSGTGPWTALRVIDTGIGIAPEEQGRIFEAFHQVGGDPAYAAGGTGLGLAISRRLARLMGGDLTVESTLGEGSTFTLWLPAARRDRAVPETAAARTARAEPDLGSADAPGLAAVGDVLRVNIEDVLAAYTDRLRAEVEHGQQMRRAELEDHAVSFLADLAQSLVILGEAGTEAADLLRDGSAIQRTVAEHHGARRHAQGWDLEALHRDHEVLREEVERIVRARLPQGNAGVDAAVEVFLGLINQAEAIGVRAWERAEERVGGA
jgi:signal transduction histidine kinase